MVYELKDPAMGAGLFSGWEETMILSCLQGIMGKVLADSPDHPESALALIGCFGFLAGKPDRELVLRKPEGFAILVPQNEGWASLIEACFPEAVRVIRYAIRKDTQFDKDLLRQLVRDLPAGYEIRAIDSSLYDRCLESPVTADFVSAFDSKEAFLRLGRGNVILKGGRIVSGASSFSRYREGIEIEVDTVESERRKHLATAACASLILRCLEEGLYPSWDAQNPNSVRLAESLGYRLDYDYPAYEISGERKQL